MAIDGVNIIDSDDGHGIYNCIVESYKDGVNVDNIIYDVLAIKFDNEYGAVFVSAIDESPRKLEYHLACTRLLQKEKPNMDDFFYSQIACSPRNTKYWLDTDCWFDHKDLGGLLKKLKRLGE